MTYGYKSLINRLPPLDRNSKSVINELQPELHPSEILHDVKKLMVVNYVRLTTNPVGRSYSILVQQQPLSATFEKIAQAASLYDLWADSRRDQVTEEEQWGQHAVQSVGWSLLGT